MAPHRGVGVGHSSIGILTVNLHAETHQIFSDTFGGGLEYH